MQDEKLSDNLPEDIMPDIISFGVAEDDQMLGCDKEKKGRIQKARRLCKLLARAPGWIYLKIWWTGMCCLR